MEDIDGVLVWCYLMEDQEIQYGGKLIVCEMQVVIFVNEGKVVDVFQLGFYMLEMCMLLVFMNLKNWDKFFQLFFKLDVYFFSMWLQLGWCWGIVQLVMICDCEFGFV